MENGNKIAFPNGLNTDEDFNGLTKREYFAGLAMQGLSVYASNGKPDFTMIAKMSVELADELLKQLENK